MSITREQIRELAEFQDQKSCAVSFYFQPSAPRNKAHKEDTILIKDLAREAMRHLESKEAKDCARADIERVVRLSSELRSNGTHGKAVYACASQNLWREYELPATLPGTQLFVDRHFHLKPIAHLLGASPLLGVVLVDRHRARIFDLRLGELTERDDLFHPLSRRGRSDGFAGYDGGHAQRRVEDEARQHFKNVAALLKELLEKGVFEKWILACQDAHRSMFEPQLHPYVSQALIGRFHADLGHVTRDEIRSHAQQILEHWQDSRKRELVSQALTQARSNARGVTGLRRVLRSLELGEVQTLLLGENLQAHAVECTACGHIDVHLVSYCPVCGRATQEIVDVGEAIVPWVIRRDVETFYVKDDPEFDAVGNIAALLRFRSEKVQPISESAANRLEEAGAEYPGRLRRFARR
ncbi:MAG TPA: host attachment protein [Candidatus Sulfotelmatobacter sp.]|nr:host attachment protein [Candidatus Sulfotelmatobacter sp.]